MSAKKKYPIDQEEYEQLMKKLDLPARAPAEPDGEPDYFNPWNMSRKTKLKRTILASLPEKLPE